MDPSRRRFLETSAAAAGALAGVRLFGLAPASATAAPLAPQATPWYRRTLRWMQTNIAEIDPTRYDVDWWREHWKRTRTQGIVVNAGGIVAFYPTQIPNHRRAEFLGERDLFGEILQAARADGIAVFARMDSNGARDDVVRARPEWFTRNATGQPYRRDQDLYTPCINGGYYREHIPAILREVAGAYHPEGFTDNSWSGLTRASICYCAGCRDKFLRERGLALPLQHDWNAAAYRAWIEWSYACRLEIWDLFNQVAKSAGGPDCLWVGMTGGTIAAAAADFRDYREICRRSEMIMLDNQRRSDATGFQANGQTGKLVHGLLGWDKLMPESFALYQTAGATFRLSARPEPEVRLWALDGVAGGIQPWWHYVNAYHEDRRLYQTPVAMGQWLAEHEEFLIRRRPIATVGILYSQRNNDFFGRDDAELQVNLPQRGFTQALTRARVPFLFVHADDIPRDPAGLRVLILPNLGTLSDAHIDGVRGFVNRGGSVVATGVTSLFDHWGEMRADFGLAEVLGVSLPPTHPWRDPASRRQRALENTQTYLRLSPELRAKAFGPHAPDEPAVLGTRHPALNGFDDTDILPFGGSLTPITVDSTARVLMTFVPPRPAFPPEAVWLREARTDVPALVVRERIGNGRVAYLAADLDRRYARDNIGDIGTLLVNLVRWAARDDVPLSVEGPGLLDCHLYQQPGRVILHVVNLTNEGTWRGPIDELIPVGPLRVRVRLPDDVRGRTLRLLAAAGAGGAARGRSLRVTDGWAEFTLASVTDHELAILE